MTSLSDTLTVGLVLVLLFGSIALYLYTRIQQAEQKISLLESILLDLKMSSEIKSYDELPAVETIKTTTEHSGAGTYATLGDDDEDVDFVLNNDTQADYTGTINKAINELESSTPSVSSKSDDVSDNDVEQYKSVIEDAVSNDVIPSASKVSVNYESMTIKELQNLAKSRGISGAGSMKKGSIIEALKTSDRSQSTTIEPGSTSGSSFLETSSAFLGESESQ
jgi:hypothetical protein